MTTNILRTSQNGMILQIAIWMQSSIELLSSQILSGFTPTGLFLIYLKIPTVYLQSPEYTGWKAKQPPCPKMSWLFSLIIRSSPFVIWSFTIWRTRCGIKKVNSNSLFHKKRGLSLDNPLYRKEFWKSFPNNRIGFIDTIDPIRCYFCKWFFYILICLRKLFL